MAKILVLNSGLEQSIQYMNPFIRRLHSYLSNEVDVVDLRTSSSFSGLSFNEYDTIVFAFMVSGNSIPSSTLEVFSRIDKLNKDKKNIYVLACCDEYETDKCDYSIEVIKQWCKKENMIFRGSLFIGSALFIMNLRPIKYMVSNQLKTFAVKISKELETKQTISCLSYKTFMKHGNKYWSKEIKSYKKDII